MSLYLGKDNVDVIIDGTVVAQPEGTLDITVNGEYDATNVATVNVNVPQGVMVDATYNDDGTQDIELTPINDMDILTVEENGVYNSTRYRRVDINVTDKGSVLAQGVIDRNVVTVKKELLGNIETIGEYAFYKSKVADVTLPESIIQLNKHCFEACENLINISLPASVNNLEIDCFKDCINLNSITLNSTVPPRMANDIFSGCVSLTKIYVPVGTLDTYRSATNWLIHASKIEELSE